MLFASIYLKFLNITKIVTQREYYEKKFIKSSIKYLRFLVLNKKIFCFSLGLFFAEILAFLFSGESIFISATASKCELFALSCFWIMEPPMDKSLTSNTPISVQGRQCADLLCLIEMKEIRVFYRWRFWKK